MCNRFLWGEIIHNVLPQRFLGRESVYQYRKGVLVSETSLFSLGWLDSRAQVKTHLLSLKPLVRSLLSCEIRDGKRTSFWFDDWSRHGPLISFIGDNGPRQTWIHAQTTVAEALQSRDWQIPLRSRNASIQVLRDTLRSSWDEIIQWLLSSNTNKKDQVLRKIACHATVYWLWRERNNRLHNVNSLPTSTLFRHIDHAIRDILLARRKGKDCPLLLSTWLTHS
ncbi:unnamed protein product [Thlaspi arvense]|uniref:Reverse transcriptase zinc-binding domain-containing protein n=1 Tax=Thlaspi arvense TaxID=13288 RepID=A0AAU9R7V8_THLAR|nr:unnamed protein product [Thlaspi arvense]